MRTGTDPIRLPHASDGPMFSYAEADEAAHRFLAALAQGRQLRYHADPVEHARRNSLLLLFSPSATEVFKTFLTRMPESRRAAWVELLSGGVSSEVFGPLTLAERQDADRLAKGLVEARRRFVVNAAIVLALIAGAVVGIGIGYKALPGDERRTAGTIRFAEIDDFSGVPGTGVAAGGAPVADPALTVALTEAVAVLVGDGAPEERLTVPPFDRFGYPPGSMRASLFEYAGRGYVAVVGPEGFVKTACLRVSVVTEGLRPLDTVTYGPCVNPVGREPVIGCLGKAVVLLGIDIPDGEVALPEGGSGFADAVRVQFLADGGAEYELLTLRGTIKVPVGSDSVIPRFGGAPGDLVSIDLGGDSAVRGSDCIIGAQVV